MQGNEFTNDEIVNLEPNKSVFREINRTNMGCTGPLAALYEPYTVFLSLPETMGHHYAT